MNYVEITVWWAGIDTILRTAELLGQKEHFKMVE
jgi:hypothetical protein